MRLINRFLGWLLDRSLGTYAALLILAATWTFANAATSYDVHNVPQMFLNAGISASQTSGITISGPVKNGVRSNFPTTSGGVLEISFGNYNEHIHYASATVNNTTKVVTLVNVTRNLCWNLTDFTSCGNGRQWGKGAYVRLVDDARLLNAKANLDRTSRFTATPVFASGATLTGSKNVLKVTGLTTAERDAIADPVNGFIYNQTTGAFNVYQGGAWTAVGTDTTANATTTVAGRVELATVADQLARTATGDNGPLVVLTQHLTSSGGSALANGRIFMSSGSTLDESTLGLGTSSGKFLRGWLYGNPRWEDVKYSLRLVNSGALTVNKFATGSSLIVKDAGTTYFTVEGAIKNGHITTGGGAPTFAPECSMSANNGNDTAGNFTVNGAEDRCSVYFNKIYTTPPSCVASYPAQTATSTLRIVTTATGFIVTEQGDGDFNGHRISYLCLGF